MDDLLFDEDEIVSWRLEWQDMPEYLLQDLAPRFQIVINFICASDVESFGKILGNNIKANIGKQKKSIWYPDQEIGHMMNKRYIEVK